MHPLDGPRLKLRRAEQHFDCLDEVIKGFLESNPYTFAIQPNPKPPKYVLVGKAKESPPLDWSAIVGDFAHNARSALNLLVFQLSSLPAQDGQRFNLQFPIVGDAPRYADAKNRELAGVPAPHEAIIEGFQPYNRAEGFATDALWLLADINNADKHRLVVAVGALGTVSAVSFGPGRLGSNVLVGRGASIRLGRGASVNFGDGFHYASVGDGVITEDGTVLAELTMSQPSQVNMQPNLQIAIQFGEASPRVQGRPVLDTLKFILNRVKEVIGEFEKVLPE